METYRILKKTIEISRNTIRKIWYLPITMQYQNRAQFMVGLVKRIAIFRIAYYNVLWLFILIHNRFRLSLVSQISIRGLKRVTIRYHILYRCFFNTNITMANNLCMLIWLLWQFFMTSVFLLFTVTVLLISTNRRMLT